MYFSSKRVITLQKQLGVGSPGTQALYFGGYFYSKNARKLRFHLLLHFHARKHMIPSFYLKWTKFTRNCDFFSSCGSPRTQTKLEQIQKFLVNLVHFRQNGDIICFLALKWRNTLNLSFLAFFWVKLVAENISATVL